MAPKLIPKALNIVRIDVPWTFEIHRLQNISTPNYFSVFAKGQIHQLVCGVTQNWEHFV